MYNHSMKKILLCLLLLILTACQPPDTSSLEQPTSQPTPLIQESPSPAPLLADQPTPTHTPLPVVQPTPAPTAQPEPVEPTAPSPAGGQLAYLEQGDIWLVRLDAQSLITQPEKLTQGGSIRSFAWHPDGSKIAFLRGKGICFLHIDRTQAAPCIDLNLPSAEETPAFQLAWSPQGDWLVAWNPLHASSSEAVGWILVSSVSGEILEIQDPVDWGFDRAPGNAPGGFTGEAVFLPDGELLGALSHRILCAENGCLYYLYTFDPQQPGLFSLPESVDLAQASQLASTLDGTLVAQYGSLVSSCDAYLSFINLYNPNLPGSLRPFVFPQESLTSLALNPHFANALVARQAACPEQTQNPWAIYCGLVSNLEVYPIQLWAIDENTRQDFLPGIDPVWDPSGSLFAFQSCLQQDTAGNWLPDENAIPGIYLTSIHTQQTIYLGAGSQPAWARLP